jgi:putative nucleotidyltransferase with HDIG domain
MTNIAERYKVWLNVLTIAVAVVFVAGALVFGRSPREAPIELNVGQTSPQTFVATQRVEIEDEAATATERSRARLNVPVVYELIRGKNSEISNDILTFLFEVESNAFEVPPAVTPTTLDPSIVPPQSTLPPETTAAPEDTTTSVVDETTTTVAEGGETTTTLPTTTEPPVTTTTVPAPERRSLNEQILLIDRQFGRFSDVIPTWVVLYNHHLDLVEAGELGFWDNLKDSIESRLADIVNTGIRNDSTLDDVRNELAGNIQLVDVPGLELEVIDPALYEAAGIEALTPETGSFAVHRVVNDALEINQRPDEDENARLQDEAAAAVPVVTVQFFPDDTIVAQGDPVDSVELDAIVEMNLLEPEEGTSLLAVAAVGGLAVLLAAFFLWRVAPNLWSEPKHFAILGILVGLAALVSRIPEVISDSATPETAYLLPAVIFGYAAAILYDPRTALLISVPVAIFTGVSTGDTGLTLFAAAATVAPVSFVSAASSRRALRAAVSYSALVMIPLAGSIAWLFHDFSTGVQAAVFGFIGGLVGGLIAQGVVASLESLFRVTTTITLLDLTDRNHPALRHIEEMAPGTFNHSILVGTLAGKAARAIDANPLLAQAAAYYHDLGKTENPQYFIENQFGVSNPHNELQPAASAAIIRNHVLDGRRLAREFRIPDDVAAGVEQHHGTGLMRYFYHQALESDPGVDPREFRHAGQKPLRKEMAILMLCDAVEGAARALAQQEDPTADSLRKLVDSVVGEKVEDRQLDESNLTFGDLTRVKHAIVEALIGYYHTRIPYPGFPGPPAEDQ